MVDPCSVLMLVVLGHTPLTLVPLSLSCFHALPISPFAFIPSFPSIACLVTDCTEYLLAHSLVGPVAVPSFLQPFLTSSTYIPLLSFPVPFPRFLSTPTSPPIDKHQRRRRPSFSILDSASASASRSLARPVYDFDSLTLLSLTPNGVWLPVGPLEVLAI